MPVRFSFSSGEPRGFTKTRCPCSICQTNPATLSRERVPESRSPFPQFSCPPVNRKPEGVDPKPLPAVSMSIDGTGEHS